MRAWRWCARARHDWPIRHRCSRPWVNGRRWRGEGRCASRAVRWANAASMALGGSILVSWRGWMAFAALGIIWGVPYFFIKLAVQELSPFVVAWGRVALGTMLLLPIAWQRGAFALAEFVIPFSAISFGERWISSSVAGI